MSSQGTPDQSVSVNESRSTWARLLAKVYEVDPLRCTRCGSSPSLPIPIRSSGSPATSSRPARPPRALTPLPWAEYPPPVSTRAGFLPSHEPCQPSYGLRSLSPPLCASARHLLHKSLRYDRAGELERLLEKDVAELLGRAEKSDRDPSPDDQSLPQEIARRERLLEKMREARRTLEERERNADEDQGGNGEGQGGSGTSAGGGDSTPRVPKDSQQINLTDPESALMRKSHHDSYQQAYNAQAVVDAEGRARWSWPPM